MSLARVNSRYVQSICHLIAETRKTAQHARNLLALVFGSLL